MIKPGVTGGKVHDALQPFLDMEGYETVRAGKKPKGFFHALGHGVGLEIHEKPIMAGSSSMPGKQAGGGWEAPATF